MRLFLLLAVLGATAVAADPLPDAALKAATDANIAHLTKLLDPGKLERPQVNRVRGTAMLVALAADKTGNGALQEEAIKLAKSLAAKDKDYAAAKAAAGKMAGAKGGTPKGGDLAVAGKMDLDVLMSTFSNTKQGGLNIEADLKKPAGVAADTKAAEVLGGRVALIAEYTAKLPHEDAKGPKAKQWDDWSKEMGTLGAALASEAGKGAKADKGVMEKKLKALGVNCNACHEVFRK